jgi:hypothetical protein
MDIQKIDGTEIDNWPRTYSEAFNWEYDPASGLRFNTWGKERA